MCKVWQSPGGFIVTGGDAVFCKCPVLILCIWWPETRLQRLIHLLSVNDQLAQGPRAVAKWIKPKVCTSSVWRWSPRAVALVKQIYSPMSDFIIWIPDLNKFKLMEVEAGYKRCIIQIICCSLCPVDRWVPSEGPPFWPSTSQAAHRLCFGYIRAKKKRHKQKYIHLHTS